MTIINAPHFISSVFSSIIGGSNTKKTLLKHAEFYRINQSDALNCYDYMYELKKIYLKSIMDKPDFNFVNDDWKTTALYWDNDGRETTRYDIDSLQFYGCPNYFNLKMSCVVSIKVTKTAPNENEQKRWEYQINWYKSFLEKLTRKDFHAVLLIIELNDLKAHWMEVKDYDSRKDNYEQRKAKILKYAPLPSSIVRPSGHLVNIDLWEERMLRYEGKEKMESS